MFVSLSFVFVQHVSLYIADFRRRRTVLAARRSSLCADHIGIATVWSCGYVPVTFYPTFVSNLIKILTLADLSAGPDLLSVGPCSEKMWGPSAGAADPIYPGKKLATFFSHHRLCVVCQLSVVLLKNWRPFFAHCSPFTLNRPFFRHTEICRSFYGGSPFVGAPVQPNMPKSAAVYQLKCTQFKFGGVHPRLLGEQLPACCQIS